VQKQIAPTRGPRSTPLPAADWAGGGGPPHRDRPLRAQARHGACEALEKAIAEGAEPGRLMTELRDSGARRRSLKVTRRRLPIDKAFDPARFEKRSDPLRVEQAPSAEPATRTGGTRRVPPAEPRNGSRLPNQFFRVQPLSNAANCNPSQEISAPAPRRL